MEAFQARLAKSKNLRIVICCIPIMGHFIPIFRLSEVIKERGHTIKFIAMKFQEERMRKMLDAADMKEVELDCPDPGWTLDELEEGLHSKQTGKRRPFDGAEITIPDIVESMRKFQPDLALIDVFGY